MSQIDTVATISDDGKTAIFISRDVDFIARIEDARYLKNAVCLGHIGQFAIYSHPASGYDFGSFVFGIHGIDF